MNVRDRLGRRRQLAALTASVLLATLPLVQPASAQTAPPPADGFIVSLRESADADLVAREHASTYGFRVSHVYHTALVGYAGGMDAQVAERLKADPRVEFVSPNLRISAPDHGYSDHIEYPVENIFVINTQVAPNGIRRVGASTNGKTQTLVNSGAGVGVAVIDTGIDLNHPDLGGAVTNGKNCLNAALTADDDNGHGSHVAGTIGARDNFQGVVGIAPAAKLIAVKSLDQFGDGSWASVICGVDWVTANKAAQGIKVANMSLGGYDSVSASDANCNNSDNDALHKAVCKSVKAGITYVVAAGNDNLNASGFVPAGFAEVITVSAWSDTNGTSGNGGAAYVCPGWGQQTDETWATGANFGSVVDIAAPGVGIKSTWKNGGYNTICGTSMASPHVAGAAALLMKTNPAWTPSQVKSALLAADTALANTAKHVEDLLNVSTF